jgi:malic enzyme
LAIKKPEDIKMVVSGAGSAAISLCRFVCIIGCKVENISCSTAKGFNKRQSFTIPITTKIRQRRTIPN